jgi:uncharacterized protein YjbI with pentapeptide repeats
MIFFVVRESLSNADLTDIRLDETKMAEASLKRGDLREAFSARST